MAFICFNGDFFADDEAVLHVQNRSFKYGDGVFETMRISAGKILLVELHFERLFVSLQLLNINSGKNFTKEELSFHILSLCKKNNCTESARVRLAVYRNDSGFAEYCIEAFSLPTIGYEWNEKGLVTDIFPFGKKQNDAYANLKSANYLIYVLGQLHAKENHLDECFVLNSENKICDATKANIFLIKDNEIITPALHQGCINGVMRRFLIDELKKNNFSVYQKEVDEAMLLNADEIFVTNAIIGMHWVKRFKEKTFIPDQSLLIHRQLFKINL